MKRRAKALQEMATCMYCNGVEKMVAPGMKLRMKEQWKTITLMLRIGVVRMVALCSGAN